VFFVTLVLPRFCLLIHSTSCIHAVVHIVYQFRHPGNTCLSTGAQVYT